MGCHCTKNIRATDSVETNNDVNVKERNRKPYKISTRKKKSASSSKDNNIEGKVKINEATLRLLIPIDEAEKKVNVSRNSSKSMFERRPSVGVGGNNIGSFHQPKMIRISSVSNRESQVMAGWPLWLASVAGEAINGCHARLILSRNWKR